MRKIAVILLLIFAVIALVIFVFYFNKKQINLVTGKKQFVTLTPSQEVFAGLQSAPQLASEFGGLYRNRSVQQRVKKLGHKLALSIADTNHLPYQFDFHVLADSSTVNAFAVPGGQIFLTMGLVKKLKTDEQLAGLLAHEIAHVIGRHTSEEMAKRNFLSGTMSAITEKAGTAQISNYVEELIQVAYDKADEAEADAFAVKCLIKAGYNSFGLPQALTILAAKSAVTPSAVFNDSHSITSERIEELNTLVASAQGRRK
jgi:predicted Zn-dependent protease